MLILNVDCYVLSALRTRLNENSGVCLISYLLFICILAIFISSRVFRLISVLSRLSISRLSVPTYNLFSITSRQTRRYAYCLLSIWTWKMLPFISGWMVPKKTASLLPFGTLTEPVPNLLLSRNLLVLLYFYFLCVSNVLVLLLDSSKSSSLIVRLLLTWEAARRL